jgi:hypothetical protein
MTLSLAESFIVYQNAAIESPDRERLYHEPYNNIPLLLDLSCCINYK